MGWYIFCLCIGGLIGYWIKKYGVRGLANEVRDLKSFKEEFKDRVG
jgi:hypothetical protein